MYSYSRHSLFNNLIKLKEGLEGLDKDNFELMIMQYYSFLQKSSIIQKEIPNSPKTYLIKLFKNLRTRWELFNLKAKADIIVWVTEENHLAQLIPILKILKSKGIKILILSSKSSLLHKAKTDGFQCLQITLPSASYASKKDAGLFENKLRKVIQSSAGINFSEDNISAIIGSFKFYYNYLNKIKHLFKGILGKFQPKLLLVGYDLPIEGRTLTQLCNKLGIETLMIQHGAIAKVDGMFSQHIVKKYLVYGEEPRTVLEVSGCKANLYVTGAPYLDNLDFNSNKMQRSLVGNKLKILIAFSGPGHLTTFDHHIESLKATIDVAAKYKVIDFYIKLHSKDNISYYLDALKNKNLPNVFFSLPKSQSKDIHEWLNSTDILVTGASNVAIEAMLHKKPVISLDLRSEYSGLTFVKTGAVKYVTSIKELEHLFFLINGNKQVDIFDENLSEAEKYVKRFYGPLDGHSSERCAAIIEESLKGSRINNSARY